MKSLNRKLSTLLIALIVIVGLVMAIITRYSIFEYNVEVTQRLNAPIAQFLSNEEPLIINGKYNDKALKKIAHDSMVINPTVEVYLLDKKGKILSFNLPKKSVMLTHVPLEPINDFLQKEVKLPIINQDPRNPESKKPFSAAKVITNGVDEGYIYVILGGKKYEELVDDLSKNYILKLTILAIIAVILMAVFIGLLILTKLTRPLKQLRDKVMHFQQYSGENSQVHHGDEIQQLNQAFEDMSNRIEKQIAQIKSTDQNRRDLVINVSHDLRTPLASMQGYLDTMLIKQKTLNDISMKEYLLIARKHCGRLGSLINDLFEFSKLDSNIVKPELEAFELAELVQDVTLEFSNSAQLKGIDIILNPLEGSSRVVADIGLMQRVLENLLSNAIKHTLKDGIISITMLRNKKSFTVKISDTGVGISASELPKIFDRLYQADNKSEDSSSSFGLGLAIVKKILDIHQTKIVVKSEINQGSIFSFSLPLASR